ncbi:MAG: DUF4416 family protein [Spirochaetota bacterium]
MGEIKEFTREKLVIGILSTKIERTAELITALTQRFGDIDYQSSFLDFNFTDYYTGEMGRDIKRFFLSFSELVNPERLADIKIATNAIEEFFKENGKRRINLDPGILSLGRFILATTKDNAHRLPLAKGIYGEITLMFKKKEFRPLEWTYPDYRTEAYRSILKEIREIYLNLLKQKAL